MKPKTAVALFFVCCAIGCFIWAVIDNFHVVSTLTCAFFVFVSVLVIKNNRTPAVKADEKKPDPGPAPAPAAPDGKRYVDAIRSKKRLPEIDGDLVLRYLYDDMELEDKNIEAARVGAAVEISDGVVTLDGVRIGVLPQRAEMVEDFKRRGDPVVAFVRSVSPLRVKVCLGFYKPVASLRAEKVRLCGVSEHADVLAHCSVGDVVWVSKDLDGDGLLVRSGVSVIGSVPTSVSDRINLGHLVYGRIVTLEDSVCEVVIYL